MVRHFSDHDWRTTGATCRAPASICATAPLAPLTYREVAKVARGAKWTPPMNLSHFFPLVGGRLLSGRGKVEAAERNGAWLRIISM
jgi:hypothetical protein